MTSLSHGGRARWHADSQQDVSELFYLLRGEKPRRDPEQKCHPTENHTFFLGTDGSVHVCSRAHCQYTCVHLPFQLS